MKQLFNNINNNKKKAFTLIELLIVIAIIGILSGAVIVAMSGTQESAIDSRIKASMAQLRSSIEIYGLVNGANYTGLESDSEISLLIDDIESQVGTPTVNISGSGDRYCLSTNLKSSNELWCIDSAGYGGLGDCINYSCDRSSGYSSGGIPISTGLVGYWTMDEGSLLSPNTIRDYSSYGNTGTIYGATFATDRHGQPNKAMSFDGVDDYIDCGDIDKLSSSTINTWINGDTTQNVYAGIVFAGDAANAFGLAIMGGKVFHRISTGSTLDSWSIETFNFPNDWYMLTITDDGTTRKYYKNGVYISQRANTIVNSGTKQALSLGRWGSYTASNSYFNGSLADVRIYNRALSAEEIAFLYNSSR
jgi:prepilin-type N-terminal cleavage/methylation domain-containing protein